MVLIRRLDRKRGDKPYAGLTVLEARQQVKQAQRQGQLVSIKEEDGFVALRDLEDIQEESELLIWNAMCGG